MADRSFSGREPELATLAGEIDAGHLVAVVGHAGMGKTTLVRAAVSGRDHRWGAGLSMLLRRPYTALEHAVRARLDGPAADVADEVFGALDGAVLVVEDLHWVHDLTVDVLALLAGRVPVVVTARPSMGSRAGDLVEGSRRIDLEPFPPRPAQALVRRLHPRLPASRQGELIALAGGNPLLLERLVTEDLTVSPTLEAALTARLGTLSGPERRTVGLLALLGRPADRDLLGGLDVPDVPDDLVVERDGRYVLGHDALAASIVALLGEDERSSLHAELAGRLDDGEGAAHDLAAGDPERALARAERAAAGASGAERGELFRLAATAAEELGRSVTEEMTLRVAAIEAFVGAGRWDDALAEAVIVADRVGDDDAGIAGDVALQVGRVRWFTGDVEAARRSFDRAAALAGQADPQRATRVAVERAFLEVRDQAAGSLALAEEALALAEAVGVEVPRARSTLGAALLYVGRPEWEPVLHQALDEAVAQGDAELEAATAYHLVSGLGFHGRLPEGVAVGWTQIARTQASGLRTWATHFQQASLIHRAVITDDPARVADDARRHLDLHRLFRNRNQVHLARILALLDLGRFDDAVEALDEMAGDVGETREDRVNLAACQAEVAWHLDDVAMAEDALALGRQTGDAWFGLQLLTERTVAHVLAAHGHRFESVLPSRAMPTWWPALHEVEGLRLAGAGDHRGAAAELHRAASQFEAMSIPRWAVRAGLAAVEADTRAGDRAAPTARRRYIDLARRAGVVGTLRRLGHPVHPDLTATEETILRQVAAGATTRVVATALGIAPTTVDQHVESARRKLGAATRLEAALQVGP